MRGVNKVILVCTFGRDPETKSFPNGGSITEVSGATSIGWKDKNTGEPREETEWHRLVFKNKLGEVVQQYLTKGSKVYVEGRLQTQKWTDKANVDHYTTKVIIERLEMLGGGTRNESVGDKHTAEPDDHTITGMMDKATDNNTKLRAGTGQKPVTNTGVSSTSSYTPNDLDDDLPF